MSPPIASFIESNLDALADEITRRMEQERPELFRRYRDRSRGGRDAAEWCKEDTAYHLRHLAAALDSGDPDEFRGYRAWLVHLLTSRGIPEEDIDVNFSAIADVLSERVGDEAAPAVDMLAAR
jgi:hypothetical protein